MTKKKWKCGGTNLPAGVSSLSHDMETEVFHSLVKELNDKLGLKLDPTTNLDREVEVGGAAGPSPVLVVGASNAARTADTLEMYAAKSFSHGRPGAAGAGDRQAQLCGCVPDLGL